MQNKSACKPELIAPGGSLLSALAAFDKGADAVYVGLPTFSARARAQNLSPEELSKLTHRAHELGKKVYVAMNTVIREEELDDAIRALADISLTGVDAVVVQDFGLLDILLEFFPELPVHASTQMAAHNTDSIRFLRRLGVKRVILPRELAFSEIAKLRETEPDMELEVFIHGALCYSFSGLCLASGMMLGRSGNRGECTQVCRSYFEHESGQGYFFSSNDLALREKILDLKNIGVSGFKIEGRMKSPEYTALASAYYKAILDGKGVQETEGLFDKLKIVFMRAHTKAYFSVAKGERMVSKEYPGHRGLRIGEVSNVTPGSFVMKLELPVMLHDGLLFFSEGKLPEPHKFGVRTLTKDNRRVFEAEAGDIVEIEAEELPLKGTIVYKISSVALQVKEQNTARMSPEKPRVNIGITLTTHAIEGNGLCADSGNGILSNVKAHLKSELSGIEESKSKTDFEGILRKLFAESGTSLFSSHEVTLANESGFANDGVFIRPSELKKFKNDFFKALDDSFRNAVKERVELVRKSIIEKKEITDNGTEMPAASEIAVSRELLSPGGGSNLPWIDTRRLAIENLATLGEIVFVPLPPLSFEPEKDLALVSDFIQAHKDRRFAIGLSNVTHLEWIATFAKNPNTLFFIDFFLYCANSAAFSFFTKRIPGLIFQYYWIEGDAAGFEKLSGSMTGSRSKLIRTGSGFNPPLFTSRACFFSHGLSEGCNAGCTGERDALLVQNKRRFRVFARQCLSYLFEDRTPRGE